MRFLDLDSTTAKQYLMLHKFDSKYIEFFHDKELYSDIDVISMIHEVSKLDFSYSEYNPPQDKYLKFRGFKKPAVFRTHEDVASFIGACISYMKLTRLR